MLEFLILLVIGIWLLLALRSCRRKRGGCGGCSGCGSCHGCGSSCRR